jgi:hypothetical protein
MNLRRGGTYFLTGYLDRSCTVPFVRTLIFLRSDAAGNGNQHVFADAIAWFRMTSPTEDLLDSDDLLLVQDGGLETVVDIPGLLRELAELQERAA